MIGEFDLIRLIMDQRHSDYDFGDVLIARASSTATASRAGASGRRLEDVIEAIIQDLGLPYPLAPASLGRTT